MLVAALLLQAAVPPASPAARGHTVAMKPAREYDGLWFDLFEGQRFYPDALDPRAVDPRAPMIWMGIDRSDMLRAFVDARAPGAILPDPTLPTVYRVRFVGREAVDMDCRWTMRNPLSCYGHMGVSPGLVIPDRMISIEDLGPVPRFSFDNPH